MAIAVAAQYGGWAAVCRDAVAGANKLRLCSPPSTTQYAPLFIVTVLLLFPDLSEVSVFGVGLKRDLEETKEELNDVRLSLNADRLVEQGRVDEAIAALDREAKRGNVEAAQTLGLLLEKQQDRIGAMYWQRFAAERGDHMAKYNLGRMLHEQGDDSEAVKWLGESDDPLAPGLLAEIQSKDP